MNSISKKKSDDLTICWSQTSFNLLFSLDRVAPLPQCENNFVSFRQRPSTTLKLSFDIKRERGYRASHKPTPDIFKIITSNQRYILFSITSSLAFWNLLIDTPALLWCDVVKHPRLLVLVIFCGLSSYLPATHMNIFCIYFLQTKNNGIEMSEDEIGRRDIMASSSRNADIQNLSLYSMLHIVCDCEVNMQQNRVKHSIINTIRCGFLLNVIQSCSFPLLLVW